MEFLMIQHNRGSAMGVSISIYLSPLILLIMPVFYFLDKFNVNYYSILLGLTSQIVFLLYFLYKAIFYYRVTNDILFYKENFEGYFTPDESVLAFVFIVTVVIIIHFIRKIRKRRNVK
jgi:hypothetical protein